jgi:hypothetical protein
MDFRTIALGVGVFCATFLVGWWLNIGGLASGRSASPSVGEMPAPAAAHAQETQTPAQPSTTGGQKVALQTPQPKAPPPKAWNGPGLVKDKLLRDVVVSWAEKYPEPPCNQDVRWGYIDTATKYAGALLRAAGCTGATCRMSNGQLQRVWEESRSALDRPVAEAMAAAHAAGGLSERSFRGDAGRAVQVIAGRDFDPGPAPQCTNRTSRKSGWRVRVRR